MVSNFLIYPQFGTIQDSSKIKFSIPHWKYDYSVRIKIENVSNSNFVTFLDNNKDYIEIEPGKTSIDTFINLNISPESALSSISLFIYLEKEIEGKYVIFDIQPLIFHLKEKSVKFPGSLNISPSFIGHNDICCISIYDVPKNMKYIFSINDKRFSLFTNDEGRGSIHFRGKDILDIRSDEIVNKYPIYYYSEESNYSIKNFSGLHLSYLPEKIKAAVDTIIEVDPRCEFIGDAGWIAPVECLEPPPDNGKPCITPNIPPGPPTKSDDCDIEEVDIINPCKIGGTSVALLPNGHTIHAFVGVDSIIDKTNTNYNVSRVFISKDDTSLDVEVVTERDVIIGSKSIQESIKIYVDDDIWNTLTDFVNNDYRIILNDALFGFQSFKIIEKETDVYHNQNILIAAIGGLSIRINSFLFGINAIIYNNKKVEPDLKDKLPFVTDSNGRPLTVLSAVIGTNTDFVGNELDNIAYVVAEAFLGGKSQLFLYSFSTKADSFINDTFGWKQLTTQGNNTNPKLHVDNKNNLNIFWESDRGGINQIYYGILGPSFISRGHAILSSLFDKQAELIQKGAELDKEKKSPLITAEGKIFVEYEDEYLLTAKYSTKDLIEDNKWQIIESTTGLVSTDASNDGPLEDVTIKGNAYDDTAMAMITLEQDNFVPEGMFDQFNYQINFTTNISLNQTDELLEEWSDRTLTDVEIDKLYKDWKDKFSLVLDTSFSNVPLYTFSNNQFVLGREDNIYDAIIPLVGAYKEPDPSVGNFQINFVKNNDTVRHFVLGLMLEKSYFKAVNSQYPYEYCAENNLPQADCPGYIAEETHTIYTGRAKLALLLKTDHRTSANDSDYLLVREFPQSFSIHDDRKFKILIYYSKLFYEDAADFMDQFPGEQHPRFICSIRILLDDNAVFGESFVVDLSDKYREFDIAFGLPTGGQYLTDLMLPSKLSVFEDLNITLRIKDVTLTSPSLRFNSDLIVVPSVISDELELYSIDNNNKTEEESVSFVDNFNFLSLGFDDVNNKFLNPSIPVLSSPFLQVPVTLEGTNISPSAVIGSCNDVHLTWQSNRDKYWNVYYTSAENKRLPFRLETKITNTESNSIMPSVSVNKNGKRMITWHDNRNGNFEIFSARSLNGYTCDSYKISENFFGNFGEDIETCSISFTFVAAETGAYNFSIRFYEDSGLKNIFATISTEDSVAGWTVNGNTFDSLCVKTDDICDGILYPVGSTAEVMYEVQQDDIIFDRVLYTQFVSIKG